MGFLSRRYPLIVTDAASLDKRSDRAKSGVPADRAGATGIGAPTGRTGCAGDAVPGRARGRESLSILPPRTAPGKFLR